MRSNISLGKRGFALAINTLVVIILGIVILGGGFMVIQSITDTANSFLEDVNVATQKEIDTLLANGELLAIPSSNREGGFKRHVFALGFSNRLTQEKEFYPQVTPVNVINRAGAIITTGLPEAFIVDYSNTGITLRPGEQVTNIPFSINIENGPRGTYTYRVSILYDGGVYAEKLVRINVI